jgi:hypothetical protein
MPTEPGTTIDDIKFLQSSGVTIYYDYFDELCADIFPGVTPQHFERHDYLLQNPDVQSRREQVIALPATVGDLLNLVGEDKVMKFLEEKAAAANYKMEYDYKWENIVEYWFTLFLFILAFAALSTITLEFIDKDKR